MDADLVALDVEGNAHHVLARGVLHVRAGSVAVRGIFEPRNS